MPTAPIDENALECACKFATPGTRQLRIQASSDDVEQDGATMDLTNGDLDLGVRTVGLRFDGISIPAGATIQSAYVQFTADDSQNEATSLTIVAQADIAAATFTTTDNDLSNRIEGAAVLPVWTPAPWNTNDAGTAQQTPNLSPLLQELVGLPGWSNGSAVVLRFEGTGHRTADSFDGSPVRAAELVVTFETSVTPELPVCALPEAAQDANGALTPAALIAECERVEQTLAGLNAACGYPSVPTCSVVDQRGPHNIDVDDSFELDVCSEPCAENPVDATCSNYDPIAFADCLATMSVAECKGHVAATNAPGGSPVCVASGSPLAFHAFGRRSRCDVAGLAEVRAGDREPQHDPATAGTLELLGGPCPGGTCPVHPYFQLHMEPITFSVRWASDPTFVDLSAAGRALETAPFDGSGLATFATDTIAGTATGRRGSNGLAIDAMNSEPLGIGVDWVSRTCTMDGSLGVGVGDDGVCTGDDTVVCRADSPDCDAVGGPCVLPPDDSEQMLVSVALVGTLVNQPPAAEAGAPQTVECTSSAGASFTLDGRGSSDPDQNLAVASWREGSRIGPEVSNGLTAALSLGVGGAQSYVLRVIDALAQTDEDETSVAVVDTTPPELSISVEPATLWAPNHKFVPITVSVVTSDICDESPSIRLLSITSNESANGNGDGNTAADVQGALLGSDDRQFELRAERSGTGSGRIYTISYEAADDSGNLTVRQTTVSVAHN